MLAVFTFHIPFARAPTADMLFSLQPAPIILVAAFLAVSSQRGDDIVVRRLFHALPSHTNNDGEPWEARNQDGELACTVEDMGMYGRRRHEGAGA
jgi:hypothetical protein